MYAEKAEKAQINDPKNDILFSQFVNLMWKSERILRIFNEL